MTNLETTYNGWKNRDTWLTTLWLQNDEWMYNEVRNNKEKYMNMNIKKFARWVMNHGCTDKINCAMVDEKEVKECIEEL